MVTIALNARTATSLTIAITAGGGETAFDLELNREPDFASDDSFYLSGLAAGNTAVQGLPSDTPWFVRSRKTNGGVGPWTATLLAATSAPAAPAGYVGFSILPAILAVPEPIDYIACAQADVGSDPYNLLDDDPQATMRATNNAPAIVFHTAGRSVDTLALMGTLSGPTATWRIRAAGTQANLTAAPAYDTGAVTFHASSNLGRRPFYHGFHRLGAAVTHEWWRIDMANANAPSFIARNLIIGLARQSVNYSRGAGQSPVDLGTMGRNRFGTPDRAKGWRGRTLDFELSWLTEAEYEAKWRDLDQLVGTTDPVFVLPNPKANAYLHDRMGFGDVTQMRAENVRSSRYVKSLEIRSIY
jgi:hypothetical protein